jgi:dTDP-4-dehydrorhamnose 3,5-epimerase
MKATPQSIKDVVLIEPRVFRDERGFFFESFNEGRLQEALGRQARFVQDNHSKSVRGVVRGLHYQVRQAQGKLVRVVQGEIFDVAVDLRRSSPTFGKCVAHTLSAGNMKQMWIPEGFAHGFLVLSDTAEVLYKTTDYWAPEHERCVAWDDKRLAIEWPLQGDPIVSAKDAQGLALDAAEVFD